MNTSSVSLEQENLNKYSVYFSNKSIASIVDNLKYGLFFYLSVNSFIEIKIEGVTYVLQCTNSAAPGTRFTLLSKSEKEVVKLETVISIFLTTTWNTFFNRTNGINYFQYQRSGGRSVWQDENKKDVLVFKDATVEFDESILAEKNELDLLISLTLCIEKLVLKKEKRGLLKSILSAVTMVLAIIVIASIFLAK
jgi:hypothetical protein